jgi:hypothetical protein
MWFAPDIRLYLMLLLYFKRNEAFRFSFLFLLGYFDQIAAGANSLIRALTSSKRL